MNRIERRIAGEILWLTVLSSAFLLALFSLAKLGQYLKRAAMGNLPFDAALPMLWLALPTLLAIVAPLAIFLAVYFVYNCMYRDNEAIVLACSGMGFPGLLRPALVLALPLTLAEGYITLHEAPKAERAMQVAAFQYGQVAALKLIQPGTFTRIPGNRVLYLGKPLNDDKDGRYEGVFLHHFGEQRDFITASWGQLTVEPDGSLELVLLDGRRYLGDPGDGPVKVLSFERYRLRLPPPQKPEDALAVKTRALSAAALWARGDREAIAELQWRVSLALLLPFLVVLAASLAYTSPRGSRAGGLVLGMLILLAAYNLLVLLKQQVVHGQLPVVPGTFAVHLGLGLLVAYAYWRRKQGLPISIFELRWEK